MKIFFLFFIMAIVIDLNAQTGKIPAGFKSIFNGKNLNGWHISRSTH